MSAGKLPSSTMSFDSTFSSFDHVAPSNDSHSAHPRSPPQPPSASVIIFGSQGSDFLNAFDPIFVFSSHHGELAAFLSLALAAIRAELNSVASRHSDVPASAHPATTGHGQSEVELLASLPPLEPFSDLKQLVEFHRRNQLKDPVINGVLLCLLQTASVIAVYCVTHDDCYQQDAPATVAELEQAWKALTQPCSHLLGYCTGILSAFSLRQLVEHEAGAAPVDIWTYAKDAIKAIRVCFWISLRSAHARLRMVQADDPTAPADHWSFLVSVKDADYLEKVYLRLAQFNEFEQQRPLDKPVPLVVSARALNQISIAGPPKQLERFKAYLLEHLCSKCKTFPLRLFSPYHTPNVGPEVDLVMRDLETRGLIDDSDLPPSQKIVWETQNANILSETSRRDAVRILIATNLSATADWNAMVDQLVLLEGELPRHTHSGDRIIVSFCPGTSLGADVRMRLSFLYDTPPSNGLVTHIDTSAALSELLMQSRYSRLTVPFSSHTDVHGDEVVIVSMACRFPGDVRSPDQLWTCLETGRSTVAEIPKHLFDIDAYCGEGVNQAMAKHMHALPESVVKSMDARLFSMSPKEIEQLDPQHRLVMLCSYEALERAGYSAEANSPSSFDGKRIAICMAASWDDYRENASWNIGSYFITGNIRAFIPGHVSFSLKWEGPSVSVDSLECSAVSALQWSRRALLSGQCDVALAGAVNVLTQPQMFIAMDKQGILSRTGTNATFSSKLDGKTRGDGCGVLLLKRRSTALRDGDTILATLPAAKTTYHGHAHEDVKASAGQSQFLARVMSQAGVRKSDLVHIEASGFHTLQGEAAEFDSFGRLLSHKNLGQTSAVGQKVSVASSRPNIGAGEAVSAMASVMKAVLMFQKASVPRQISISDLSELQPSIAAACVDSALFVPIQAQRLPSERDCSGRRIILINSLATTDCQGVVLVGAPTRDEIAPSSLRSASFGIGSSLAEDPAWIFMLSAKTRESAEAMRKALVDYLQRDVDLPDLSYTLACRRTHHPFRLSVVASEKDELIRHLRSAEFNESKTQNDLLPLGFIFCEPGPSSPRSAQEYTGIIPGQQDRFEELTSALGYSEAQQNAESYLHLMHICLALLLDDCGVSPSFVRCSPEAMQLVRRFFPAAGEGDPSSRRTWVQIGDSISIFTDAAAEQAMCTASSIDAQKAQRSLLCTLGTLHQRGYPIRWIEYFRPHLASLNLVRTLPTYPFSLQQHWMEYHDRNLLPRPASGNVDGVDGKKASHAGSSHALSTSGRGEAFPPPSQPLLSEQTAADETSRTYRSGLPDEALTTLLRRATPGAVMVELVTEAIKEVCESILGDVTMDGTLSLCLYGSPVADVVEHWAHTDDIELSVAFEEGLLHGNAAALQMSYGKGPSRIHAWRYEWLSQIAMYSRWSRLQKLLPEKIASIKDEGELFSAKFIYKGLDLDSAKVTKSIQSAHLAWQSREAVVLNSFQAFDSSYSVGEQLVLPQLLTGLEEIARWYCGDKPAATDGSLTFICVEELRLCAEWTGSLTHATGSTADYTVYISQSQGDGVAVPFPDEPELDMLILDSTCKIVGELTRFRLAQSSRITNEAHAKKASESVPAPAQDSNAAVSPATTKQPTQPRKPLQQSSAKPVAAPKKQTSRAVELHTKVLDVLASELGIAVDEMKPSIKFADLGLDSLMSLVCISTLETLNLGFELPQSLFMECDSPAELLQYIRDQVGDGADDDAVEEQEEFMSGEVDEEASRMASPSLPGSMPAPLEQATDSLQSNAAATQVMKTIRSTIETELGVDEGSIDPDANLADLGMDSLMSLLVLSNLSGALPIELPSSLFMDCTSLREIHAFVESQLGDRSDVAPIATVDEPVSVPAVRFSLPPVKPPILLRRGLNPQSEPPLFLLPEGAGMSSVYQLFPAIDRPIYSINSPFLADTSAWTGGIAQIARYYLESIKLVQPVGPWLVGGWSFGGMAAFEIARSLASMDGGTASTKDRVAGLFILDSPSPSYPPLPMTILDWINTAPEVKDIAPPTMSAKLIAHFRATVESLAGWTPRSIEPQAGMAPKTWYIVADDPLPGQITDVREVNDTVRWLFRSNRAAESSADGWQHLIPQIRVVAVQGANHFTMVKEPAVTRIADVVQEACRSALQS